MLYSTAKDHSASQFDRPGPVHAFPVRRGMWQGRGTASIPSEVGAFAHRAGPRSGSTSTTLVLYPIQHRDGQKGEFTISDWVEEGGELGLDGSWEWDIGLDWWPGSRIGEERSRP